MRLRRRNKNLLIAAMLVTASLPAFSASGGAANDYSSASSPSSPGFEQALHQTNQFHVPTVMLAAAQKPAPSKAADSYKAPETSVKNPRKKSIAAAITSKTRGMNAADLLAAPAMSFAQLTRQASIYKISEAPRVVLATALPQKVKASEAPQVIATPDTKSQDKSSKTAVIRIAAEPTGLATAQVTTTPSAAAVAALNELSAPRKEIALHIDERDGALTFTPKAIHFDAVGDRVDVKLGVAEAGLNIFVRDQSTLEWNSTGKSLVARAHGVTELYVVAYGKMYIVPVVIDDKKGSSWDLEVPNALVSLEGVFAKGLGKLSSALYPDVATAANAVAQANASDELQDSIADTKKSVAQQDLQMQRYQASATDVTYKQVTIQMIDDRSNPDAKLIYPLNNIRVSVVGTEFVGMTDTTGHLTIRDMPTRSRFLVRYEDPEGRIRPGVAEIDTADKSGVLRFKAMREFTFDANTRIAGVVQDTGLGSVCGMVTAAEDAATPSEGVSISLDISADGPYYFNSYGFLDRTLAATGNNGRFCFFNVAPGPVAVSLFDGEAYMATLPMSVFAGRHNEELIHLSQMRTLTTSLAAMPTAHEQLGSDPMAANTYKTIDMIDLIPLGGQGPMMQVQEGQVTTPNQVLSFHGRAFALSQAAEFESVLYSYGRENSSVTPLIPRGFVEDMALYAQVSYDPQLGTALVEHGAFKGQEGETVNMRLINEYGEDVGNGWYYNDAPTTRAIFFNIPAGTYMLLVETADKYWLAAETVVVYNETVSYVRTGSALRYRP